MGNLTYDATREDPYEHIKFFCDSDFSARAVIFFSSNFTSKKRTGIRDSFGDLQVETRWS
ncbi:DUF6339 family protein [Staphylococcus gallinarum]|uniref:DUF6339 family protein n=1 Tax=Staphylococcus gallinarum TaxID=1293 RepID=UPI0039EFC687